MIEAELIQDRRLQIMHMYLVFRDVESEVVGRAVGDAWFNAAAG